MDAQERELFEALLGELARLRTAIETHGLRPTAEASMGKAVLNVQEAAIYLNTTRDSLYDIMKREAIPFRRIGRKIIFSKAELAAWLAQLPGISVERATATVRAHTVFVTQTIRLEPPEPAETPAPEPLIPLEKPPPRLSFRRKEEDAHRAQLDFQRKSGT